MKEHPILFSTPMIQAILLGTKSQTRRVIKVKDVYKGISHFEHTTDNYWISRLIVDMRGLYPDSKPTTILGNLYKCPYGEVGDRLWVRETWVDMVCVASTEKGKGKGESNPHYKASSDSTELKILQGHWKPSIFMPRKYSRITLEITDIRVQRLQEISEQDAYAEGCPSVIATIAEVPMVNWYKHLWDGINAKSGYGWDKNPFVWCISFKVIKE